MINQIAAISSIIMAAIVIYVQVSFWVEIQKRKEITALTIEELQLRIQLLEMGIKR